MVIHPFSGSVTEVRAQTLSIEEISLSFSFDKQGLCVRSYDFFQAVKMGLCKKVAVFCR